MADAKDESKGSTKATMNQTERNALVKVVRSRFEVGRKYAKQRRNELRDAIFARLMEEGQAKIEAAERDMAEIQARARKLEQHAAEIVAKHKRKGVKLGSAKVESRYTDRSMNELVRVVVTSTTTPPKFSESVSNQWYLAEIAQDVDREYRKLEREFGLGEVAMARQEQELIEEILLGGVNPEAAREFLERVPSLKTLPAVEDVVKQIGAGR